MADGSWGAVPKWSLVRTDFIGEPIAFQWTYDGTAQAPILFEIESFSRRWLGVFDQDSRRQTYADGREKEVGNVNDTRYWQVRAVDSQTKRALSSWSAPLLVSQYDSVYHRIAATGKVRVVVSRSQNQGVFKWLDGNGYQGFEIKLVDAVVAEPSHRMGRALERPIIAEEWSQLLRSPSEGRADLIVSSITRPEKRTQDFRIRFSQPYFCTGFSVIHRPGEPDKPIRELIAGRRLGVQADSTGARLAGDLKATGVKIIPTYPNLETITADIRKGDIDFGLTDTPFAITAQIANRHNGQDRIEYAIAVRSEEFRLLGVIDDVIETKERNHELIGLLRDATREFEASRGMTTPQGHWAATDHPWDRPR